MKNQITPTQKAVKITLTLTPNQIKFLCDFLTGQYVTQSKLKIYKPDNTKQLKEQVELCRKHLSKSDLKENKSMEKLFRKSFVDYSINKFVVDSVSEAFISKVEEFEGITKKPVAMAESKKLLKGLEKLGRVKNETGHKGAKSPAKGPKTSNTTK